MSKGGGATAIGPRSTHWRSAIALMASFAGFALIFGFTIPLCALILEADGVSTTLSGAITAISAAGMMVASPFVGRMTALFGTRRVMFVAAVLTTATIVLLPVLDSVYAWFPIRSNEILSPNYIFAARISMPNAGRSYFAHRAY